MIRATVTALAWQFGRSKLFGNGSSGMYAFDEEANFLLLQMNNMPDYLRLPFRMVTLFFGLHTILFFGKPFSKLRPDQREKVILSWKNARVNFMSTFIRFHESLVTVYVYSKQ